METLIHGALVDGAGIGVLLVGARGIGKSQCALEWIRRGGRLVADDRVRMRIRAEDPCLLGTAPTLVEVAARETTQEAGH